MSNKTIEAFDWGVIALYLTLVLIGWAMAYAVGYDENAPASIFDLSTSAGRQGVWVLVSMMVGGTILLFDAKFFKTFAYIMYAITLVLLLVVLLVGVTTNGATAWLDFGSFRFQPSELAKVGTCLALSAYLSGYKVSLSNPSARAICFAIIGVPIIMVLLQDDTGSALVFMSFMIILFREGLPAYWYVVGIIITAIFIFALIFPANAVGVAIFMIASILLAFNLKLRSYFMLGIALGAAMSIFAYEKTWIYTSMIIAFVVFAAMVGVGLSQYKPESRQWSGLITMIAVISLVFSQSVSYVFNNILKPHQQSRINVWLQPHKTDPMKDAYNLTQSKLAIGSGGFSGKGYLNSTFTRLNYVPASSTDFIFCIVGEEQGFIGGFAVILLFMILLLRISIIAERQEARFTRVYAYGAAGILSFHLLINIGMTIGLMPVIGIPLPFISYGGSSLLAYTILLAILIRLDASRSTVLRWQ